jgi:short-subunit dehydrogenase
MIDCSSKKEKVMNRKIALVTGASAGIGFATAKRLAQAGFIVYAAARRVEKMEALREYGVRILALDVTDDASIEHCIAHIRATAGDIDVLVNNAGYGSYGALEEIPMAEAHRQFDVNVFGLAAMTQKVLAPMRRKRWGRVINISSIGGVITMPYGGWYHASKFAVEAYSSSLRQEVKPFGVNVVVIRPGGTKSEWGDIAMQSLTEVSGRGPYAPAVNAMEGMFRKSVDNSSLLVEPEVIAELVLAAATAKHPKTVYVPRGYARIFLCIRRLLSDRLYDAFVRVAARLPARMGNDANVSIEY